MSVPESSFEIVRRWVGVLGILMNLIPSPSEAQVAGPSTFRVIVDTDLGNDPDDKQSLYRLLHYTDILKVEGIVLSPGPGRPVNERVAITRSVIQDADIELQRENGYTELMTQAKLLSLVKPGSNKASVGSGPISEGARLIIDRARAGATGDLWILVWGSLATVAEALHHAEDIKDKIRIYYIGSWNTQEDSFSRDWVHRFMRVSYNDLWWIENGVLPMRSRDTFRGVYLGGNQSGEWGSRAFIDENINPFIPGGDFPRAHGGILKEGDSPSMLYLLSPQLGAVGNVEDPTQLSWGGRFRRADARYPNYYVDLNADAGTCQATINRWRVHILNDWKQRWRRYLEPKPAEARAIYVNHAATQHGNGSRLFPFSTVSRAVSWLRPGERLVVAPGNYPGPVSVQVRSVIELDPSGDGSAVIGR